jgi:hypothetical protein
MTVFWVVASCSVVEAYRRFRELQISLVFNSLTFKQILFTETVRRIVMAA